MSTLLLRGADLVTASGCSRADVRIQDGVIAAIGADAGTAPDTVDVAGKLLFPGLIDCHVHFREPGLEHKSTMRSEAASAVAGGVTTVCEMPNTVPPTVTASALADKIRRATEIPGCDLRFFFGVTQDAHLSALRTICAGGSAELDRLRSRIAGVKLYLDHSTGNQKIEGTLIEEVFAACVENGLTVVCHCEDSAMNAAALAANARTDVAAHPLTRPPESEAKSVEFAIELARKTGARLHVAHASTSFAMDLVANAKKEGLKVTCEVAPHHLFLTAEDMVALGTLAKMNPPLRSTEHRDALWKGIQDGTVDCVSTDHAPHTLEEKRAGEPLSAPSGVPGVETMVPLLLSVCAGKWPHPTSAPPAGLRLTYADVVRLCRTNPDRIFRLGKPVPAVGAPVDLVLVDPAKSWTIAAKNLHSACTWTPFEGWVVTGAVERVVGGAG